MAKRRNAKKEKAARNKINARKYRKPTSRYSKKGGRRWSNQNNQDSEKKTDENNSSQTGASDINSSGDRARDQ